MKKILPFILILIFICSCSVQKNAEETEDDIYGKNTVMVSAADIEQGFRVYMERELPLSLYEPEKGCYSGAYILSDKNTAGDIELFEEITETEHCFYTYFMKMGQNFPTEWVLNCLSHMKTPNIILEPENIEEPYNLRLLEETAKKFGEFYIPMFVHLYPVSGERGYSPDEYKAFYKTARFYFSKYASNVCIVWDLDSKDLALADIYYPGDKYVDWVGLNLYVDSAESDAQNALLPLEYFSQKFQDSKPIFISQVGISHFSTENHAYSTENAKKSVEYLYNALETSFPRVKAINYMNYNGIDPVNMPLGEQNYSITSISQIIDVYNKSLSSDYILSAIEYSTGEETALQTMSFPVEAVYFENYFYVKSLPEYLAEECENTVIADENYYRLASLSEKNYIINPDFNLRKVTITAK